MPKSSVAAAAELRSLLRERRVTARDVVASLERSEAWISRRLNNHIPLVIDDYTLIKEAIEQIALDRASSEPAHV